MICFCCSYSVVSEWVSGWSWLVSVAFCYHEINEYTLTSQSNNHWWWLIFIVPTSVFWPLWKASGKRESIPRAQLGHRQPHKSSTLILPDSPLLAKAPNWMLCILGLLHLRHMLSGVWTTDTPFVFLSVILIHLTSLLLCSCLDAWLDSVIKLEINRRK